MVSATNCVRSELRLACADRDGCGVDSCAVVEKVHRAAYRASTGANRRGEDRSLPGNQGGGTGGYDCRGRMFRMEGDRPRAGCGKVAVPAVVDRNGVIAGGRGVRDTRGSVGQRNGKAGDHAITVDYGGDSYFAAA